MRWGLSNIAVVATGIAAWIALFLSGFNAWQAYRSRKLAERQEERKRMDLILHYEDAHVRLRSNHADRIFAFRLRIDNPADTDNAVASARLRLRCKKRDDSQEEIFVCLEPESADDSHSLGTDLKLPVRVDAHQTVVGWVSFQLTDATIEGHVIDTYTLIIMDTNNAESTVQPILVKELRDEA